MKKEEVETIEDAEKYLTAKGRIEAANEIEECVKDCAMLFTVLYICLDENTFNLSKDAIASVLCRMSKMLVNEVARKRKD